MNFACSHAAHPRGGFARGHPGQRVSAGLLGGKQLHMDVTGGTGRLAGKRVLVTGGTTGIGLAIADRFLREGAMAVVTGRDSDLGRRAEVALAERGRAWFVTADAGDPDAVARSVDEALDRLGDLDILVNNAGIGVEAGLLDTPLASYDRLMDVNVRGYLLYAQAAYPHLARRRGCMIHIASDAGVWGEQSIGLYSVSKAAVVMLGKMLALEGGRDGVRSNVLCPGDTWPGMRHMAPPGEDDRPESGDWPVPPIGRIGEARDVAAAAVFYASDEAEFVTGTVLLVDGGMTAGYHQRERSTPGTGGEQGGHRP
jgi:NAD(P)-dependent dehydrogenase (short-subunit alcohol dehydrogenase family)